MADKKDSVGKEIDQLGEKAAQARENVDGFIQENPEKSVLIAAGVGAGVGAIVGALVAKATEGKDEPEQKVE